MLCVVSGKVNYGVISCWCVVACLLVHHLHSPAYHGHIFLCTKQQPGSQASFHLLYVRCAPCLNAQ